MKPKYFIPFTIFFIVLLGLEIGAEHHFAVTGNFTFLGILQPLLIFTLIVYLLLHIRDHKNGLMLGVLAGLGFDWVSDVILTLYKDAFNLPSMMGYFAGHVCYAFAFGISIHKSGYKVSFINRIMYSLPPLFYIVIYYLFIYDYISTHEVKNYYIIPTSLYVLSIMAMATTALWRMGTTNESSYWCITTGALFYMLSDSITGYDHFVQKIDYRYVATMFTYGISLMLFTFGAILHRPVAVR